MAKQKQQADKSKTKKKKAPEKISHQRRPDGWTIEKWQLALRKQFAGDNDFDVQKISDELVYADYIVSNPSMGSAYKVALRSPDHRGDNFCACYDFKISRLGTCKHIEAVFRNISKKRLKKHLKTPVERPYSSVYLDYRQGKTVKLRIGVEYAEKIAVLSDPYFDDHLILTEYGLAHFEVFLKKAREISPEFRCYEDALEQVLHLREINRRHEKINLMNTADQARFLHNLVKTELFPYQQEGALFAWKNNRVIIGDEMGLGKTLQALAAAQLMRRESGAEKILILCPTSLKYQWKTEIEKFTDHQALVIEGGPAVRHRMHLNDESPFKIASYHSALFDFRQMNEAGYDLIILDEAQRIKNWRTKIAQSVRKIQTSSVFVLTGTPVENNLEELYGLAQFVDPFALGPRHIFFPRYQTTDDNGRVIGYENLGEIRQLLANQLIRRTKKQVLTQLPKRTDKNLIVPITVQQRELHREYADNVAKLVLKWQRMKFLSEQDRQNLLKNLNLMRMVCDSTYIVDQSTNYQTKIDELVGLLEEILEIEGEKVVIFSQWARMNDLVARRLQEMGVNLRYLHGGVHSKDRGALYTEFNQDPDVRVFLSTDAGGVGLNLQSAAWLINLDIPWNPGTLEQRIGRIFRLGQEKPVNIINLVAQETIEHNLLGVLQFKKGMAAGVLDDGEDAIFMGDSKFKRFMASVETITRDTVLGMASVSPDEVEQPKPAATPETPEYEQPESVEEPVPESASQPHEAEHSPEPPSARPNAEPTPSEASPQALVQNGLRFFSQLAQTLSDSTATEKLVKSLVEKDEKTGQTYVKLPVENEKTVENVLNLFAGLVKAMGQNG